MADHTNTLLLPDVLPNEILSHIFIFSAKTSGTVHLPFQKRQIPIQVIIDISHVSSPWRQVALDTRELWTDVSIENLSTNELQVYQTWLSRAGRRPVHLALDWEPDRRSSLDRQTTSTETTDIFWKVVNRVRVGHLKLYILLSQLSQLVESPESTSNDLEELDLDITIREDAEIPAMPQFISRARSVTFEDMRSPANELLPLIQRLALP